VEIVGELLRVGSWEWLKHNHIKWLKRMGWMRRKHS
jgi:hypothetical protein